MIGLFRRFAIFALLKWDVGLIIPIITFSIGGLALLAGPEFDNALLSKVTAQEVNTWLLDTTRLSLAQWGLLLMVMGLVGVWRGVLARSLTYLVLVLFYANVALFTFATGQGLLFCMFLQVWGLLAMFILALVFSAFRITLNEYVRAELENRKLKNGHHKEAASVRMDAASGQPSADH